MKSGKECTHSGKKGHAVAECRKKKAEDGGVVAVIQQEETSGDMWVMGITAASYCKETAFGEFSKTDDEDETTDSFSDCVDEDPDADETYGDIEYWHRAGDPRCEVRVRVGLD